jgi:acyl-CoA synthetase (NDP forming)
MKGSIHTNVQIHDLFFPRSVAIIGVPRSLKTGRLFLMALIDQGFPGPIYPVNPHTSEIDGLKAYPSLSSIPGPVDLAIILVPQSDTLPVLQECALKGVKGAVLFTAGYSETGTAEGRALEAEIVRVARASGIRLIGPNGMGFYCPKSGLSFFPQLSKEHGSIGIISHSGSLANILGYIAGDKGLRFSKMVSIGNECDLSITDFLDYLGEDDDTRVVGIYMEGIKEGSRFIEVLRRTSLKKPVIIWKVGLTPEGARAAASHTGALAGSDEIWQNMARQGGAIPIAGFEAFADTLMGFSLLDGELGDRIAVISGPGGLAVSAAEACGFNSLKLAKLMKETQTALSNFVPPIGTSLKNPIDVGMTATLDIDIYIQAVRIVAEDPSVDTLLIIGIGLSPETNQRYTESLIDLRQQSQKPFLMVNVPGFDPSMSINFRRSGLPFFETAERAVTTYARIRQYQQWRKKNGNIN